MLTRRGFFGTVAAVAVGSHIELPPIVPPAAITPMAQAFYGGSPGGGKSMSFDELRVAMTKIYEQCRRDDGDTILEPR